MAQRTTMMLVDDLDGSDADESLEFSLDGVSYEIDLTDVHAASLRDALAPSVAHTRRTGRGRGPAAPVRRRAYLGTELFLDQCRRTRAEPGHP